MLEKKKNYSFLLSQKSDPKIKNHKELFDIFKKNIRKHKVEKNITIHRTTSQDLAKKWTLPLKVLWIDGDHSYEAVINDLNNCKIIVENNGVILCDDYDLSYAPGVKKAIDEFVTKEQYDIKILCKRFAKISKK